MKKSQMAVLAVLACSMIALPSTACFAEKPVYHPGSSTKIAHDEGGQVKTETPQTRVVLDGGGQARVVNSYGEEETLEKYELLFRDSHGSYYVDTENTKWKLLPYSANEYIIDVWIRLGDYVGDYQSSQKYFLEHYYLRPKTQQVQFLSELEVTGRPQNNIVEREYSPQNWEYLVSGSLEDEIYHAVLRVIKEKNFGNSMRQTGSVRDWIENTLNISL